MSPIFEPILFCLRVCRLNSLILSVNWSAWVADPLRPKLCSLIQNNIGSNIGDGLNFVACERTLTIGSIDTDALVCVCFR